MRAAFFSSDVKSSLEFIQRLHADFALAGQRAKRFAGQRTDATRIAARCGPAEIVRQVLAIKFPGEVFVNVDVRAGV